MVIKMLEIILFLFLFLILVFIGLKVRVEILDYDNIKIENNGFRIKIKVYVFGIKMFEITFTKTGVKYLKSKKEHEYKLNVLEFIKMILDKENSIVLNIISYDNYKDLDIKIKEFDAYLKIGVLENIITSFTVTVFSTIFSMFIGKRINITNKNKIFYKVEPVFDELYFNLKLKLIFDINSFNIYKFLLKNKTEIKKLYSILSLANKRRISDLDSEYDNNDENNTHTKLKESSI